MRAAALTAREQTMRCIGHDVKRESGVGKRIEQAILEHEARTVPAFLTGLEHEQHRPRQFVTPRAQQSRRAHQHRHVTVMSTGVHGARLA